MRPRFDVLEGRTLLSDGMGGLIVDPTQYNAGRLLVRELPEMVASRGLVNGATTVAPEVRIVELTDGMSVATARESWATMPGVLSAEPDYRVTIESIRIPNDPMFGQQDALLNNGQTSGLPGADIDAPSAWGVTTGRPGVIVAVIDTGIDYNHPDLQPNIWTNPNEVAGNGVDDDGNGYVDDVHGYNFVDRNGDPMDTNGHGTHVAGTIGAVGNNGIGVAGVAWNVKLMALKFIGANGGYTSDAIEALRYAVAQGATISNNSWGSGEYSDAMRNAIRDAGTKGHLFVAAAGNDGVNADTTPHYPSGYDQANIISVGATTRIDYMALFSNYGRTTVDLGAPGASILSTMPGGTYGKLSGTSMAAPHVTGVAALLKSRLPGWTASQIKTQILATVDRLSDLATKTVSGGRLNAYRALTEGIVIDTTPPAVGSVSLGGLVRGTQSSVTLTFTHAIDSTSLQTSMITIMGPAGEVPVTSIEEVAGSNSTVFRVYAAMDQSGSYSMSLSPGVMDWSGNMIATQATASWSIDATAPSLVVATPGGVARGPLASIRLTFSEAMNAASLTTSAVLVNGPSGLIAPVSIDAVAGSNGSAFDVRFAGAGLSASGTYSVLVLPQTTDLAGNNLVTVGSASFAIDALAPRLLSVRRDGLAADPLSSIVLTFSKAIAPATMLPLAFTLAGPNGVISVGSAEPVQGSGYRQYRVRFATQSRVGSYTLSLAVAGVTDWHGLALEGPAVGSVSVAAAG